MAKPCPVCGSSNTVIKEENGLSYLVCKQCHFNEGEDWDEAYPEQRSNQREKGKHTPYKRGGGQRTRKP